MLSGNACEVVYMSVLYKKITIEALSRASKYFVFVQSPKKKKTFTNN